MPKILVVTRLVRYPGETTSLYWDALGTIFRQEWDGQLDHFLQNGGDDPQARNECCTRKASEAREYALNNGYDAILFADHDMLLPQDALRRLWATGAPIAYGLYVLRHARDGYRWSAAVSVEERSWQSLTDWPALARDAWGKVLPVAGMGFGCTLIRREVLKALPMRWYEHAAVDWALALDAQQLHYAQVCDLGVICGHRSENRIYWPDINQPDFYRVEEIK